MLMIAIFFILDRYLKNIAILGNNVINLIGNILTFNFTPNYYIAFSLPISGPILNLIIILLILSIFSIIIYLFIKNKGLSLNSMALMFILFGAINNLADRLLYGFVIDYLELRYFTVFNLSDAMISAGALILVVKNIKSINGK